MLEARGDIWEMGGIVCVTTNGVVDRNGNAVMGAGIARQARDRYPQLATELGYQIGAWGNVLQYFPRWKLITFPTKNDWRQPSTLVLVQRSCRELARLLDSPANITEQVFLPRPGCGYGGLDWETEVRPICERMLDDRVTIVTY